MIQFNDEAFDPEDHLRMLGLDSESLARARRAGDLRCRHVGCMRLYKGEWLQQWLSKAKEGNGQAVGQPSPAGRAAAATRPRGPEL